VRHDKKGGDAGNSRGIGAAAVAAATRTRPAGLAGDEQEDPLPLECDDAALASPGDSEAGEPETAPCYSSPLGYFVSTFLLRSTRCDSLRQPQRARTADGQR
jgi:hypothetical protein